MNKRKTTRKTGVEPMISPNNKPLDVPEFEEFMCTHPAGPDGYLRQRPSVWRVRRPGQRRAQEQGNG